jgi:prophage regulatory protein
MDGVETQLLCCRNNLKEFGIRVSNTTLLRWEAKGRFPRRIRLAGTSVAWLKSEIDQWLVERAEERSHTHYADY